MLDKQKILHLFHKLNENLHKKGEYGEIGIVGGAVMCIVYDTRKSTKDVDAIFEPSKIIRQEAASIALEEGIDEDWLNDAVKAYIQGEISKNIFLKLSNLTVWIPQAEYILAMKCIAARYDTYDKDDIIFLLKHLKIKSIQQVFETIETYYPKKMVPVKTQFFLEEIFENNE